MDDDDDSRYTVDSRGVRRYELGVRNDLFCINGCLINT
eukprot:COSAG02_NODE_1010_length_15227_cov_5.846774_6_plen_38_part_00